MAYRQKAQQSSQESLGAARERYNKAMESGAKASGDAKESAVHGLGATIHTLGSATTTAEKKSIQAAVYVGQKVVEAKDVAVEKGQ